MTVGASRLPWVALALPLLACAEPAGAEPTAATAVRAAGSDGAAGEEPASASAEAGPVHDASGLEHVERIAGRDDPEAPLPLVVGLHGLGGEPEGFAEFLAGLDAPARIVAPRAPYRFGRGYSWGETEMREGERQLPRSARRVAALAAEIAASRPTLGRPILVGYSQGGCVAFLVAAQHAEGFGAVVPIAGSLPPGLVPEAAPEGGGGPAILALHGASDPVTWSVHARRSVVRLRRRGHDARVRVYEGVGHGIQGAMLADLQEVLRGLVAASASGGAPVLPPVCPPCPGHSVDVGACSLCLPLPEIE